MKSVLTPFAVIAKERRSFCRNRPSASESPRLSKASRVPALAKLYSNDAVKLSDDGRKRFVKEMNEVRLLAGRGMQPAEIAARMKLDERVVRAHLAMGTWLQPPNADQVPAK